jgi:hypothetical protein
MLDAFWKARDEHAHFMALTQTGSMSPQAGLGKVKKKSVR